MAVEIGALRALLSLDSAAFEKGAKRAQASMNSMQRAFSKTSDRMQKIGRTMTTRVTAPIVAGIGLMGRSAVRNAVEIERLSQVANAGTTEFQRMAAGARDVGIEQDKLADILKDTNDRVGDFLSTGGGPMADFFENIAPKVGVTAEQFKNLSGPDALQLYVSSLEKAGVNQQEMTFYMEALASDATLLLPLLRNNGKEMNRLGDAAQNAGAVMDAKTIKALLRTRDAMRDAGDAAKGLFNQIMASLAPVMEVIAEKVQSAARWFSDLSPRMQKIIGIGAAVAAAIGPLAIALGFVAAGLAALASPIGLVVLGLAAVVGVTAAVVANWDELIERFPKLGVAADRAKNAFWAWVDGLRDVSKNLLATVGNAINGIVDLFQGDFAGAFENFKASWASAGEVIKAAVNMWVGIIDAIVPGFRAVMNDVVATVKALPGQLYQVGADAIQRFVDGIKEKWAELKESVLSIFRLDGMIDGSALDGQGPLGQMQGKDIGAGLPKGILDNKDAAYSAGAELANEAEQGARDASETRSPSRVWMRIGNDLMDGLSVGIGEKAQEAAAAASNALSGIESGVRPTLNIMGDLKEGFKSGFKSILTDAESFADGMRNALSSVANSLINSGIDMFADTLFKGISGGFSGGKVKIPEWNIANSFDGGGYTGSGPRSGGLDGKGGFLAMMHPDETVIDHTKGQSFGGRIENKVEVNVIGAERQPEVRQDGNRIDIDFRKALKNEVQSGGLDSALGRRFGMKPKPQGI